MKDDNDILILEITQHRTAHTKFSKVTITDNTYLKYVAIIYPSHI